MSNERHGCTWTKKEDKRLKALFNDHKSFAEMGEALQRTWFACKCRLIRLGLIEGSCKNPKYGDTPFEPFRVPNPELPANVVKILEAIKNDMIENFHDMKCSDGRKVEITMELPNEEDTSRTFSDAELNIVTDYFKTRLAKLAVQKLDTVCFQKGLDISRVEDIFKCEIGRINNMKKMSVEEREKVLTRIA